MSSSIDAVSPQVEQPDILKQLAILEEKAQTAVQALSAAQIRQDALRKAITVGQTVVSADDQEIQATQSALNTAKIEAAKANSALTTMKASLPAGTTDLKTVTEQSHVLTEAIKTHQEQLKTAQRQLSEFDRQLAGLHADERHATDQITTLKKEHQEAEDDFLSAVTDYFGSDGVAKFAAMREKLGQLPLLQQQTQRYKDDVLKQQTLLAAANKTIGNQPQPALDQLEAQASAAEVEATKAQTAFIEAKQKHDTAQKLLKQAADILAANQTALAAYADLQTLTAVMNGNGPKKLSLERYVLQAYLQEVLDVANTRLQVLSNQRYQFVFHSGLEIDVYDDQVGERRAVQTLSGGESFIAALSLALALGEVIQQESGGINIDALFVDEGFGSLDTNSLDVAMNALESLEGESRLIGIISHVTELRDNIPDQLQVQPAGTGRSRIRVMHMATA